MKFINATTDFAFKKIFGSNQSKDILISFLNATIYRGKPTITDLEIIDPYSAAPIAELKDSYLDVQAKIIDGTTVIIEMQLVNVRAFQNRVLYNTTKAYSRPLKSGQAYSDLKPVIALNLVGFNFIKKHQEVISHFVFKEKDSNLEYPQDHLQMIFVELPKFKKTLEELETITDKWIYFLKNSSFLEAVPETMEAVPEIQKAFEIANAANLSSQELAAQENREKFIRDQQGAVDFGRDQGMQQGLEQGKQQGKLEGQLALLQRQLERRTGAELPEGIKTRLESLDLEKLEDLGDALLDFNNLEDLNSWLADNSG
ncbi:MAG: Rpn family recombination-promoting nuclease/putative transposase [Oscillatoria sp. SIO1A7]|nr:Rpn family recombination-promoting nuclease/putative transposase [Oscillatoria sp. SIO1A7]